MRRIICVFLVVSSLSSLFSQSADGRYSEEEITKEKQFIEAKKYKLLGDYDAAKDLFQQILKKYRNHDVAAYELAEILSREKNYEDALYNINLALGIEPTNRWYLNLKAKIFIDDSKFHDAALVYESLTTQFPEDYGMLEKKAWLYAKSGDASKAIEVLDELETHVGVTERTAYAKHDLYKQMGKKSKAISVLEDLIDRYPLETEYRHVLASYYKQIGKESHAEDVYRQILVVDANDARATVALASSYRKEGNQGGYLSSIRPIINNPEAGIDIKIAELMPYIRQLEKSPDPAMMATMLELADALESAHPEDPKSYALHGDLLSLGGQDEEAVRYYKKTLELDESNYLVWEQLLMLQAELGQMKDLASYSEEAMEIFPNQATIFYMHGLAELHLGNFEDAVNGLEQSLMMVGKNDDLKVNIYALLGKAYHDLEEYDKSIESYDNALLIRPAEQNILNDYSFHLAQRGERLKEAEKMIDKALAQDKTNPRFLATKAWIYYRMPNMEKALTYVEESIKNGGDQYGYVLEKYGDILYKLDQKDKAIKYWRAASEKGLGSGELIRKIESGKLIEQQ